MTDWFTFQSCEGFLHLQDNLGWLSASIERCLSWLMEADLLLLMEVHADQGSATRPHDLPGVCVCGLDMSHDYSFSYFPHHRVEVIIPSKVFQGWQVSSHKKEPTTKQTNKTEHLIQHNSPGNGAIGQLPLGPVAIMLSTTTAFITLLGWHIYAIAVSFQTIINLRAEDSS